MKSYQFYADGTWHDPSCGTWIDSENPADGAAWARVPDCNADDVGLAVPATKAAFYDGSWGRMTPADRGRRLHADPVGLAEHKS